MVAPDLRSAIRSARLLHRAGAGAVLDVLWRSTGMAQAELGQQLRRDAGVVALFDADGTTADFSLVDRSAAHSMGCVPLRIEGEEGLWLALADPWDEDSVRKVSSVAGPLPRLAAATSEVLERWLGGPRDATARRIQAQPEVDGPSGPVVDFVDSAIRAAFANGASDVHFECDRGGVTVKLRQDGVMSRFARLDNAQHAEETISRIKVLAQLDITERRTPQDGRFRMALGEHSIDLRVSIMPSVFGEDAVLRLLDKAQLRSREEAISLDQLGFDADSARAIRELAELPHGMLLVTGPTGSGKTTTVYAVLSEINSGNEKVITIEDPVEYELPGVLQIPVNERKGLTFAKGLRSILRHDPDRILVGEIRDAETAEIAVQSALTGHQVFTTVHANSIHDVTGRFRHFGIDMFGFMSALNGVVVQRLVRRLCDHCAARRTATEREQQWLAALAASGDTVPLARGCVMCQGSGYRGRVVIAEVHWLDDRFRDLITTGAPVSALRASTATSRVPTLSMQGACLVQAGATTPEEIKRVVGWQ